MARLFPLQAAERPRVPDAQGRTGLTAERRRRLVLRAVERANEKLVAEDMEPIGQIGPHGLRRTFASLRVVAGDDPVYVSGQLGHEDATFTLKVYAQVVKHRERLTAKERQAFERAVEWARMGSPTTAEWALSGTTSLFAIESLLIVATSEDEKPAVSSGF